MFVLCIMEIAFRKAMLRLIPMAKPIAKVAGGVGRPARQRSALLHPAALVTKPLARVAGEVGTLAGPSRVSCIAARARSRRVQPVALATGRRPAVLSARRCTTIGRWRSS